MRSEHSWSQTLDHLRGSWPPNSFFVRNTLSLLASLGIFCWICGAAGNLLRTHTVSHFDWLNLLLAYIWAPLAILSVTWLALFRWELTYVTRRYRVSSASACWWVVSCSVVGSGGKVHPPILHSP